MEELARLAVPGTEIVVRVTPRAGRAALSVEEGMIRLRATAPPERGKANEAAARLLAAALGLPRTRLELARGATARTKTFRVRPA